MSSSAAGELLRAAGNYANLTDYEKARAAGAPLEPLASLVLVIDEFSELLTAKPDFIDMFIQIGRIGRSLGVHLLLASQRTEEGRLRGLDTYLSYRIGLRTFSAAESRTALGVPDAYHLPSVPGSGFLKFGTEGMTRFKAAYVSGTYRPGVAPVSDNGELAIDRRPVLFTAAPVAVHYPEPEPHVPFVPGQTTPDALADTVLDVIARRLEGQGPSPTRCGCRRSPRRPRSTGCCPGSRSRPNAACTRPSSGTGRSSSPSAWWTSRSSSAATLWSGTSPAPPATC